MTHQSASPDAAVEFLSIEYRLPDGRALLSHLDLQVRRGETVVLLGRSGSGKTTTLKLVNRMLEPTSGNVMVGGRPAREWDPIQLRRSIGYVIQEVGLFPHYTAEQNIATVPRLLGWDRQRIRSRVEELMELVGLPAQEFRGRYPYQLSGGQRQRVGLARALAADPPILLMDEPFGALDPLTRAEIQQEFRRLQSQLKKTVLFVTHDVIEALTLGDHIALMENGTLSGVYSAREFLRSNHALVREYLDTVRAGSGLLAVAQDQNLNVPRRQGGTEGES